MGNSESSVDRRDFIKSATATGVGVMLSGSVAPLLAAAPGDRLRVGVMGLNGRGVVHAKGIARMKNAELAYLCDVDSKVLDKSMADVAGARQSAGYTLTGGPPKPVGDFRRMLDDKSVDAVVIATPDHWHTPAAILAMQAGKHVYVEKPCGHNPREGELIVQAQQKYGKVVQMGTQQRSHDRSREVVQAIHAGAIGVPYLARAWYANTRVGIGRGKAAPVPANLDYDLWQGPAPHTPYRDNVVHYNWHWFWRWGTGEVCNNGTHEIDIARWALGVDFPTGITSVGTRKHYDDDWEFPDTQEVCYEFAGGKTIVWQGQSCNGSKTQARSRGTTILGTMGSVVMDRDGYSIFDLKDKVVKESIGAKGDALNMSADDNSTQVHVENWLNGIRSGEKINAPIDDGAKSVLLCHLGNIAQKTGHKIRTDPANGHILDDKEAQGMWTREYAPAWTPVV
jgi:predicted dehydrogenase